MGLGLWLGIYILNVNVSINAGTSRQAELQESIPTTDNAGKEIMNEVKPRPAFSPSDDVVVLEAEICLDFYKLRPETRKQTFTQENCKHGGRDMGSGGRGGGCYSANFIYGITPHIKLYT